MYEKYVDCKKTQISLILICFKTQTLLLLPRVNHCAVVVWNAGQLLIFRELSSLFPPPLWGTASAYTVAR
jgi:hypothetical protein